MLLAPKPRVNKSLGATISITLASKLVFATFTKTMLHPNLLKLLRRLHSAGLNPLRHNFYYQTGEIVYSCMEDAIRAATIIEKYPATAKPKKYKNTDNVCIWVDFPHFVFVPNPPFHLYGVAISAICHSCQMSLADYNTTDGKLCVDCGRVVESAS